MTVFLIFLTITFSVFFFKLLNSNYVYKDISINSIKSFLTVLLLRGKITSSELKCGSLLIYNKDRDRDILFLKYYEQGRYGIYINIPLYYKLKNKEKNIYKYLDKKRMEYFKVKSALNTANEVLRIDIKNDINLGIMIFKFITLLLCES